MTFEEKLKLLEETVYKMESDQLGLKDTVELYQKAIELSNELNEELNESLKKLAYIVENGEVKPLGDIESEKKDI